MSSKSIICNKKEDRALWYHHAHLFTGRCNTRRVAHTASKWERVLARHARRSAKLALVNQSFEAQSNAELELIEASRIAKELSDEYMNDIMQMEADRMSFMEMWDEPLWLNDDTYQQEHKEYYDNYTYEEWYAEM